MVNVIIIGNTNNFDFANSLINSKKINIVGGVVDKSSTEIAKKQELFLNENNIEKIELEDIPNKQIDICLILTYSKIIDTKYFKNTLCLNIHAGILPKWRGFNANAWAIMNNENKVGYTIHEATDEFDGGDIYYCIEEEIAINQKYGEIIPKLRKRTSSELPDILFKISKKEIVPQSQKNKKYFCCAKLRKEDGIIKNWNITSRYVYNLFRIMGTPYGTGIFFTYKHNTYEILNMNLVEKCDNYCCINGAIVNIFDNKMWVKTLDNIIEITKIHKNGNPILISKEFKIGNRLD